MTGLISLLKKRWRLIVELAAVTLAGAVVCWHNRGYDSELITLDQNAACVVNEQLALQGLWYTADPPESLKDFMNPMFIYGDTWTNGALLADMNRLICGHFRLDPTKSPKQIDFGTSKAIYELEGDTLKICGLGHGKRPKRPTTMPVDTPSSGYLETDDYDVYVFKWDDGQSFFLDQIEPIVRKARREAFSKTYRDKKSTQ